MANQDPLRFRIDGVRADWPVLFKGQQFQGTGSYRCGIKLIVPTDHPQYEQINDAIFKAAQAKWKEKAPQTLKSARAKDNVCLRDGDLQVKAPEGYAGNWVLSANCQGGDTEEQCVKPQVRLADRTVVTDPAKNPIYRGCYVNAVVEFYGDSRYGDGVFCKLVGVQFAKEGDAFGSAPARTEDFEDLSAGANADDFA